MNNNDGAGTNVQPSDIFDLDETVHMENGIGYLATTYGSNSMPLKALRTLVALQERNGVRVTSWALHAPPASMFGVCFTYVELNKIEEL